MDEIHEHSHKTSVGDDVTTTEFQIKLPADEALHARIAACIVKSIQHLEADVIITDGAKAANARSVFSLLTLGAEPGAELTVHADGADGNQAVLLVRETLGDKTRQMSSY